MSLADEVAQQAMIQTLRAMRDLPPDALPADRMKLVNEASRLLERIETKTTHVSRLGDVDA